jgi:hypothetical protein
MEIRSSSSQPGKQEAVEMRGMKWERAVAEAQEPV